MVSETHKVSYTPLVGAANGLVGEVAMVPAIKLTVQSHACFKMLVEINNLYIYYHILGEFCGVQNFILAKCLNHNFGQVT